MRWLKRHAWIGRFRRQAKYQWDFRNKWDDFARKCSKWYRPSIQSISTCWKFSCCCWNRTQCGSKLELHACSNLYWHEIWNKERITVSQRNFHCIKRSDGFCRRMTWSEIPERCVGPRDDQGSCDNMTVEEYFDRINGPELVLEVTQLAKIGNFLLNCSPLSEKICR